MEERVVGIHHRRNPTLSEEMARIRRANEASLERARAEVAARVAARAGAVRRR